MRIRQVAFRAVVLTLVTLGCQRLAHAEWYWGEDAIMGTAVRVQLWHDSPSEGTAAVASVMDEMNRINALMSTYVAQSALSQVNARAASEPVAVTQELFDLLQRAQEFAELTEGAFDITYASVGYLYDYRRKIKPDAAQREAAIAHIDYRFVSLDAKRREVRFLRDGVRVDLGGIAKGYAVERAAAGLRARGVRHAIVSAGGDSRIIGDRRGRPWTVGVRDPRDAEGIAVRLPLQNEAVSTSGDYERYFEADGVRHHHIINPATGTSPAQVRSVTVIGPDATMTDALSTGAFVLGIERGLALVDTQDGYEAVIYDARGKIHYCRDLTQTGEEADRQLFDLKDRAFIIGDFRH